MTVFIYLLGFGVLIPILPLLSRDFGATPLQIGLLMSVYSLMQFIFAPFWGQLSDRIGRRKILLFCLLGEGVASLMFALSRNFEMLFAARILAGFFGASLSTASAAISDLTPKDQRSKGMALIGAAFGLGFVFGPALGGGLALWSRSFSQAPHFEATFAMCGVAILCFANFLFGLKFLKESLHPDGPPQHKQGRLKRLREHFLTPTLGGLMSVYFLSSFAMSSMEANLVLDVGARFGWGLREMSFGFVYIGVMIVITQGFLVRRMLPRFGERKLLPCGLALFAIGLSGLAFAPTIPWIAVAMTLLSIGSGLTNPATLGSISLLTSEKEQGVTMGSAQSLASLGRILGPAVGGFLFQNVHRGAPFAASGTLAFIALAGVLWLGTRIPDHAKQGA